MHAFMRTVDTDVLIIALRHFHDLGMEQLWLGFGTKSNYRAIPVHEVCHKLGADKCKALLYLHAFSGCDITSFLQGIGKKTHWTTWASNPSFTSTFIDIIQDPNELHPDSAPMKKLEEYTVTLYSKHVSVKTVNEARRLLFTQGHKTLENLPPTQAALLQHAKRAALAATQWERATQTNIGRLDPQEYGWAWDPKTLQWTPYWTSLPDASHGCMMLVHCGYKTACKVRNWRWFEILFVSLFTSGKLQVLEKRIAMWLLLHMSRRLLK
jgi:hypothetical protein